MGGDNQTTIMVLKVDLQCHKCYKKIKKVLCKFPQIQDQVYDEKANTVTIKVVCCSPDCIKKKIICKGGDTIKSIDIKLPDIPKPKPPPATGPEKPKPPPPEKPKPTPQPAVPFVICCPECREGRHGGPCFYGCVSAGPPPKEKPKPAPFGSCCPECREGRHGGPCFYGWVPAGPPPKEKPKPAPFGSCCPDCREGRHGGPCFYGWVPAGPPPKEKPKPAPAPAPAPVPVGYPPVPFGSCCPECREGRHGGPCMYGWVPAGPPPCYQYGRPVYDSYGGGRGYCVNRCDYFSEENTGAYATM